MDILKQIDSAIGELSELEVSQMALQACRKAAVVVDEDTAVDFFRSISIFQFSAVASKLDEQVSAAILELAEMVCIRFPEVAARKEFEFLQGGSK